MGKSVAGPQSIPVCDRSGRWELPLRVSGRARRASFRASPWQGIELVVPRGFDLRQVATLVQTHRLWLERRRAELACVQPAPSHPPEIRLETPRARYALRYRGQSDTRPAVIEPEPGALEVYGAAAPALQGWLKARAALVLPPMLEAVVAETGLAHAGVCVRLARSRWGSCSARRKIMLNATLLFLPPELVRHVMVHELCHTRYLNHSSRFWALVEQHDPDWRSLRSRLREEACRLIPAWVCG